MYLKKYQWQINLRDYSQAYNCFRGAHVSRAQMSLTLQNKRY